MQVVINVCFGGFSLSKEAVLWMAERGHRDAKEEILGNEALVAQFGSEKPIFDHKNYDDCYFEKNAAFLWANPTEGMTYAWHASDLARDDPLLVQCVVALGERAWGPHAQLKVVQIPDGVEYEIAEYDGSERIAEKHRTWG